MRIQIINGPNINLLGKREPSIYGSVIFEEFLSDLRNEYADLQIDYFQSNVEGELINVIQNTGFDVDGIILNAAAYTHTSIAILDAIRSVAAPVIEVHISNVHEIRTPLNAIVGFSELLAVAEQDEERSEYLEIIRLNNDLLQQLVADILDISKIEAGTLEFTYSEVDVNQIILDLGQYFQLKSEEQNTQINVLIEVPEIHNTLYSDRNRLMQVLSNFMTNALKFTEKGNVTIGYKNCDKNLHFYVRDTGKGIAPNKLELIFKRFVRLDTQKVGAGLGLAICEKIVHRLGGEIGVDSIEGEGSTFWFTIPVDEKESL